jgi:UDP-N-acetyl-D-mannosaminuronic acid dehydrogenase
MNSTLSNTKASRYDRKTMENADIIIVGGCGHVGLPLGMVLASSGYRTGLYDIAQSKVDAVNAGKMPFIEANEDGLLGRLVESKVLFATSDPQVIKRARVVILTIGTPVDEHLNPRIQDVLNAVDTLTPYFKSGQTIILRSTLFPGTSQRIADYFADRKLDVSIAFCPERIAQGKALTEMRELPQIISAFDDRGHAVAEEIFGKITLGKTFTLRPIEAELAKLFCNTWRYINFAVSNQFLQIANAAGADFDRIHQASVKDYPRMNAFAKAGFAAGPCLFKDTMQLSAFSQNTFFLGHSAMLVNEGMPAYALQQLKAKLRHPNISGKRIAILGMTFKRDNDDIRESLSFKLRKLLKQERADVVCHDPYLSKQDYPELELVSLEEALKAQAILVGTPHSAYDRLPPPPGIPVIDIWGILQERTPA